jgi:hypothetical protein
MEKCVHLIEYGIDVYEDGRVWVYPYVSRRTGKTVKGRWAKHVQHRDGYICVSVPPPVYNKTLHGLVAAAYIPNPLNRKEINHINGIKDDNSINNLEWCTRSENLKHAHRTGLTKGNAKLTTELVREIRRLYDDRELSRKQLAAKYNISYSTIIDICSRHTWKSA